jgi:hypothetical protein
VLLLMIARYSVTAVPRARIAWNETAVRRYHWDGWAYAHAGDLSRRRRAVMPASSNENKEALSAEIERLRGELAHTSPALSESHAREAATSAVLKVIARS